MSVRESSQMAGSGQELKRLKRLDQNRSCQGRGYDRCATLCAVEPRGPNSRGGKTPDDFVLRQGDIRNPDTRAEERRDGRRQNRYVPDIAEKHPMSYISANSTDTENPARPGQR
jgi:hypothetical protein